MNFIGRPSDRHSRKPGRHAERRRALRRHAGRAYSGKRGSIICDNEHNLIVRFKVHARHHPREEGALGIREGTVRDIAIISRVNKPVCFVVTDFIRDAAGRITAVALAPQGAGALSRAVYIRPDARRRDRRAHHPSRAVRRFRRHRLRHRLPAADRRDLRFAHRPPRASASPWAWISAPSSAPRRRTGSR